MMALYSIEPLMSTDMEHLEEHFDTGLHKHKLIVAIDQMVNYLERSMADTNYLEWMELGRQTFLIRMGDIVSCSSILAFFNIKKSISRGERF